MNSFNETGLRDEILKAIKELGFEKPTPIQEKTIPHLLDSNQDLIATAQTGTGKTAAFGLPSIQLTDRESKDTQTLVLSPTRELCLQITSDLESYAKHINGLRVMAVYGGSSIENQIKALNKGAQIVIATPGRAVDLIKRKKLRLGKVGRVILDEADEMLSMGFKDDLNKILAAMPEEKQTLLFSATMSKDIKKITSTYMSDPFEIEVERVNTGTKNVTHVYYQVAGRDKYELLKRLADSLPELYGIVFCRTRAETKDIAYKLHNEGYNADALHGDLSQAQRDKVMKAFRDRKLQVLVATDVAARGLDVNELTHVINFNLPDDNEVYVHRSGRTGRAGNKGISIAMVSSRDLSKIKQLEKTLNVKFAKEEAPKGDDIVLTKLNQFIDKLEKTQIDEKYLQAFLPEVRKKLDSYEREELIRLFVSAEINRTLDYYKFSKDINQSSKKSDNSRPERGDKRERKEKRERHETNERSRSSNADFARIYLNVGAKQNINPARLIGMINDSLDHKDVEVGKIEVLKKFTFFEVDKKHADDLIFVLSGQQVAGVHLLAERTAAKPDYADQPKIKKKPAKDNFDHFKKRGNSGRRRDSKKGSRSRGR